MKGVWVEEGTKKSKKRFLWEIFGGKSWNGEEDKEYSSEGNLSFPSESNVLAANLHHSCDTRKATLEFETLSFEIIRKNFEGV